jgi:hypothetical protein
VTTPTSVDASGYVDLTLLDVDTQDLVDRALADLAIRFPEWQPAEGNTEVVLIEAMALEVAELVYAINRVPGAVTEVLLRLFGLTRSAGTPPKALVTFTTSNTGNITIPAGTTFTLSPGLGLDPVTFRTDVDLLVAGGVTSSSVAATGTDPVATANLLPASSPATMVDAVAYVDAATATITTAGVIPEDATAFLNRGVIRLRRLVTTLTLNTHFTAAALESTGVKQATTLDRYNPAVGPAPGSNLGHVTVAVAGPGGVALTTAAKTTLETSLEAQAVAGLDVHVIDATVTNVNVTVTVTRTTPDVVAATVSAAITAALTAYLNPDLWQFGGSVYVNELIALIDAVPGVGRVVSITLGGTTLDGAGNAVLTGYAPLAKLGTATVTVQ